MFVKVVGVGAYLFCIAYLSQSTFALNRAISCRISLKNVPVSGAAIVMMNHIAQQHFFLCWIRLLSLNIFFILLCAFVCIVRVMWCLCARLYCIYTIHHTISMHDIQVYVTVYRHPSRYRGRLYRIWNQNNDNSNTDKSIQCVWDLWNHTLCVFHCLTSKMLWTISAASTHSESWAKCVLCSIEQWLFTLFMGLYLLSEPIWGNLHP